MLFTLVNIRLSVHVRQTIGKRTVILIKDLVSQNNKSINEGCRAFARQPYFFNEKHLSDTGGVPTWNVKNQFLGRARQRMKIISRIAPIVTGGPYCWKNASMEKGSDRAGFQLGMVDV